MSSLIRSAQAETAPKSAARKPRASVHSIPTNLEAWLEPVVELRQAAHDE